MDDNITKPNVLVYHDAMTYPTCSIRHPFVWGYSFFLLFAFLCQHTLAMDSPPAGKTSETKSHAITIVREFTLEEEEDRYSVHITYPSMSNPAIDDFIASWVHRQLNLFTLGLEAIPPTDATHFSMKINYALVPASSRVVSVIFTIVTHTGDPILNEGFVTFSFDVQKNKLLSLKEIFIEPDELLLFLSAYCRNEFTKYPWANQNIKKILAGTQPEHYNFSLYTLDPQGITFYFPPNQITEKSYGMQKITIPIQKLRQFSPDMALWGKREASSLTQINQVR